MIANWNRFEGILKERNEFDHTVIADFSDRSIETKITESADPPMIFIHPFVAIPFARNQVRRKITSERERNEHDYSSIKKKKKTIDPPQTCSLR